MRLEFAVGVLEDTFGNANAAAIEETFSWTAGVVADHATPRLLTAAVVGGHLRLTFNEEVELASATSAIALDGQTKNWLLLTDAYTLESFESVTPGPHTLTVSTTLLDLAGTTKSASLRDERRRSRGAPNESETTTPRRV